MNKFKTRIMLLKLRGNRTLNEVALCIGVSGSTIRNYESGLRMPCDEIKVKLAKYYHVSVQQLFYPDFDLIV